MGKAIVGLLLLFFISLLVWRVSEILVGQLQGQASFIQYLLLRVLSVTGFWATFFGLLRSFVWLRDRLETGTPESSFTKPFETITVSKLTEQINLAPKIVPFLLRSDAIYLDFPNLKRIAILGSGKAGKSREGLEYIRRLINTGLVIDGEIICPRPGLIHFGEKQAQLRFQGLLSHAPKPVLFLDEIDLFIKQHGEKVLDQLTACLNVLNQLPNHYAIATLRTERLNDRLTKWLSENEFILYRLDNLTAEDILKLVDYAAPLFNVKLSQPALNAFKQFNNGTPYLVEVMLRKLTEKQKQVVSVNDVHEVFIPVLREFWSREMKLLEISSPAAVNILNAVSDFYLANAPAYLSLLFPYAVEISQTSFWEKTRTKLNGYQSLKEGLDYLQGKYKEIRPTEKDQPIEYAEVIVEDFPGSGEARHRLTEFLSHYRRWADFILLRFLHQSASEHAEAINVFTSANEKILSNKTRIRLYTRSLALAKDSGAYNNRGAAFSLEMKRDKAMADYKRAIALNPSDPRYFYNLGVVLMQKEKPKQALKCFSTAIQLDPEYLPARFSRASAYEDIDELDSALEDYSASIKLDPLYAASYNGRGSVQAKKGNFDESILDLTKAIELDDQESEYYCDRGAVLMDQEKYAEAFTDLTRAIELDKNNPRAYFYRGECNYRLEKYGEGITDLSFAIGSEPDSASAYYFRGLCFLGKDEDEKAIVDFDASFRLYPFAAIYVYRGTAYAKLDMHSLAIKDLTKAIKSYPDETEPYLNRAAVFLEQKKYKRALADIEKAIGFDSKEGFAYYLRGQVSKETGNQTGAEEDLAKAVELGYEENQIRVSKYF